MIRWILVIVMIHQGSMLIHPHFGGRVVDKNIIYLSIRQAVKLKTIPGVGTTVGLG